MKKVKRTAIFTARLPTKMVKKLDKEARKNGASRNAEITRRLNDSLKQEAA